MSERIAQLRARLAPVIERIAADEGCTADDIYAFKRDASVSRARHRAMAVVRWSSRLSLPMIGKLFGRDHTTVLMGIKRHERELEAEHARTHEHAVGT